MAKDEEWSDLLKLPAEVIIKELRIELGKQNAYIEELKENLKEEKNKANERVIKLTKLEHLEKENNRLTLLLEQARDRIKAFNLKNTYLTNQLLTLLKKDNNENTIG